MSREKLQNVKDVGQRFRDFGNRQFGSLSKFAETLKISQPRASHYASGARQIPEEILQRLADIGCDITWLMTGKTQGELDQAADSFFITKAREILPGDFEMLDYLKEQGIDSKEKLKSVLDTESLAHDIAVAVAERRIKYAVKQKKRGGGKK